MKREEEEREGERKEKKKIVGPNMCCTLRERQEGAYSQEVGGEILEPPTFRTSFRSLLEYVFLLKLLKNNIGPHLGPPTEDSLTHLMSLPITLSCICQI